MGAAPVPEAPLIGNLKSPYAQVCAFINNWRGFSTVKNIAWVGENNVSPWRDRKTRRLRKKAKREYNERVRQLALFVKKRDKRVLQGELQRKKEEEEKAVQAKLRQQKLEKEKLVRAGQYDQQEGARVDEDEEVEVEEERNTGGHDGWYKESDSVHPGGDPELYCIVCNKKFKSDNQWKNHEQSKKYEDRVIELNDMFEEDRVIELKYMFEEDSLLNAIVESVD